MWRELALATQTALHRAASRSSDEEEEEDHLEYALLAAKVRNARNVTINHLQEEEKRHDSARPRLVLRAKVRVKDEATYQREQVEDEIRVLAKDDEARATVGLLDTTIATTTTNQC